MSKLSCDFEQCVGRNENCVSNVMAANMNGF